MTMVGGNMFDNALKAPVDALCGELAQLISTTTVFPAPTKGRQAGFTTGNWWPADLGAPSASGGQNDARYAILPSIGESAGIYWEYPIVVLAITRPRQDDSIGYSSTKTGICLGVFS